MLLALDYELCKCREGNLGVGRKSLPYGAETVPPFSPYHSGLSLKVKVGCSGKVALTRVLLSG